MKELKTLSLSITRPLEESSLLMVLGGAGGGTLPDKSKNGNNCGTGLTTCTGDTGNCSNCGYCGYCAYCSYCNNCTA